MYVKNIRTKIEKAYIKNKGIFSSGFGVFKNSRIQELIITSVVSSDQKLHTASIFPFDQRVIKRLAGDQGGSRLLPSLIERGPSAHTDGRAGGASLKDTGQDFRGVVFFSRADDAGLAWFSAL